MILINYLKTRLTIWPCTHNKHTNERNESKPKVTTKNSSSSERNISSKMKRSIPTNSCHLEIWQNSHETDINAKSYSRKSSIQDIHERGERLGLLLMKQEIKELRVILLKVSEQDIYVMSELSLKFLVSSPRSSHTRSLRKSRRNQWASVS